MYLDQAIGVSRQLVDLSPFPSSPFIPRITRHTGESLFVLFPYTFINLSLEMRSLCSVVVLLALLSLCSAQFKINCGYQYPNGSYVSLESLKGTYYLSNVVPSNSTPPTYAQPGYNISLEVSVSTLFYYLHNSSHSHLHSSIHDSIHTLFTNDFNNFTL